MKSPHILLTNAPPGHFLFKLGKKKRGRRGGSTTGGALAPLSGQFIGSTTGGALAPLSGQFTGSTTGGALAPLSGFLRGFRPPFSPPLGRPVRPFSPPLGRPVLPPVAPSASFVGGRGAAGGGRCAAGGGGGRKPLRRPPRSAPAPPFVPPVNCPPRSAPAPPFVPPPRRPLFFLRLSLKMFTFVNAKIYICDCNGSPSSIPPPWSPGFDPFPR